MWRGALLSDRSGAVAVVRSSRRAAGAAAAVWAAVIVAGGLLPTQGPVEAVSRGYDSSVTLVGHFASYALWGFLLRAAIDGWGNETWRGPTVAFVLTAALGGSIEAVQGVLPYRDAQMVDVLTNLAGVTLGLLVFSCALRARRSRARRG